MVKKKKLGVDDSMKEISQGIGVCVLNSKEPKTRTLGNAA